MGNLKYIREHNITNVIRLNKNDYSSYRKPYSLDEYIKNGVQHDDLPYDDGDVPTDSQIETFLETIEKAKGVTLVHCGCMFC